MQGKITSCGAPQLLHCGGNSACHGRQYSSEDYITYLTRASATDDEHRLGQELVGGVAALCSTALSTISLFRPLAREEGCGSDAADDLAQGKWKRFGMDIAVDASAKLWLIEFNHKPGMRAARGATGQAKRQLVARFYHDEGVLLAARSSRRAEGFNKGAGDEVRAHTASGGLRCPAALEISRTERENVCVCEREREQARAREPEPIFRDIPFIENPICINKAHFVQPEKVLLQTWVCKTQAVHPSG